MLALYGALGFDGLGHYTLALCSQHSRGKSLHLVGGHCGGGALGSVGLVPEIANDARHQPTLSAGQR
jgi:hypothetical protein